MRRTRRTNKKSKRSKRSITRKTRKRNTLKKNTMKGGNFGGQCPDPNFSIYNSNILKLFPYSTFLKG